MSYGPKLLFTEVNLNLNKPNRYGLVGANGAGKSTFMRLLAGEEEAGFGEISLVKNTRIGWLKQDQFRYENTSIIY
jgi:ATPase subunit of ABC transporter with duplicated ATPase domains